MKTVKYYEEQGIVEGRPFSMHYSHPRFDLLIVVAVIVVVIVVAIVVVFEEEALTVSEKNLRCLCITSSVLVPNMLISSVLV